MITRPAQFPLWEQTGVMYHETVTLGRLQPGSSIIASLSLLA
jgi:hypothetical protein